MIQQTRVAGLATIALLKTHYDRGRDHIDMFQPFIDDVIATSPSDELSLDDVRNRVEQAHGLRIPLATLNTLLSRATRRGVVKREGGRYFRQRKLASPGTLAAARKNIEREHATLARSLIDFASADGRDIGDEEEALHILLTFLSTNHTELLLDDYVSEHARQATGLSRKDTRIIARFIDSVCFNDAILYGYLERIIEGLVLQNALLLRDIAQARRQFRSLQAFFDSGFLFGLIGLKGSPTQAAYAEVADILRATNVRLHAFDHTIDEMKRILAFYEDRLATAEGRRTLWANDLTRHFLTHDYSPSQIRQIIALLTRDLQTAGITISQLPKRDRRYTLEEESLAQKIKDPRKSIDSRVLHDVSCVAGVLVVRADTAAYTWEDARAVFVTTNRWLVTNVTDWYRESDSQSVTPIIHVLALSNMAWLKKPAAAQRLKLRELVALCEAALRPSREMWAQFLVHLSKLDEDGKVTSDESVAILASEFTDRLLSQLDDEEHVEANSVAEIVDRVRQSYKADADTRVAAAEEKTAEVAEHHRRLVLRMIRLSNGVASVSSYVLFGGVSFGVGYALLTSVPGLLAAALPGSHAGLISTIASWLLFSVAYASLLTGHHLTRWRQALETRLRKTLRHWLLGGDKDASAGVVV